MGKNDDEKSKKRSSPRNPKIAPPKSGHGEVGPQDVQPHGWATRFFQAIGKPIVRIWSLDMEFHTRLTSFVGIAALLVALITGIAIPLLISANSGHQPTIVTAPSSTPLPPTDENSAGPCSAEETDGVQSCVLGRFHSDEWQPAVAVSGAGVFDVQIYYRNASDVQQKDVNVRVEIPGDLNYLTGTTALHNANGTRSVVDGIAKGGLNIGGYLPTGDAYLKFSLLATDESTIECGDNIRVVNYVVVTSGGNRHTALPVTITKFC